MRSNFFKTFKINGRWNVTKDDVVTIINLLKNNVSSNGEISIRVEWHNGSSLEGMSNIEQLILQIERGIDEQKHVKAIKIGAMEKDGEDEIVAQVWLNSGWSATGNGGVNGSGVYVDKAWRIYCDIDRLIKRRERKAGDSSELFEGWTELSFLDEGKKQLEEQTHDELPMVLPVSTIDELPDEATIGDVCMMGRWKRFKRSLFVEELQKWLAKYSARLIIVLIMCALLAFISEAMLEKVGRLLSIFL